ncbi:hypothetical protein TNCV_2439301 [Trichonephila clavipes]|nr:hypothetical protein TNCV_2439301 [Trichonephila clavipes]
MCCAMVRDVTERSVTAMRTFECPHVKWCTEVDVMDHVGPSYPPASNGHISSLQLFGFVQHDYRSLKDNPLSRYAPILPLSNSNTGSKADRCILRDINDRFLKKLQDKPNCRT